MVDLRKLHGASEAALRKFTATELYLKRARKTVTKMMVLQWTQDFNIATLEARDHWGQWRSCWRSWKFICRPTKIPRRFANRVRLRLTLQNWRLPRQFRAMYLFIKVHVPWLINIWRWTAKEKGGFIDHKTFKTAGKYGLDSLIWSDANMPVINGSILYVRLLLKPQCPFVRVNSNGGQHVKFGKVISKIRVITKLLKRKASMNSQAKSTIRFCQKTKNTVHYQKLWSRKVAEKAHECLQKLQRRKGSEVDEDVQVIKV